MIDVYEFAGVCTANAPLWPAVFAICTPECNLDKCHVKKDESLDAG